MRDKRIIVALDGMLLGGYFSGVEHAIWGLAGSMAEGGRHRYRLFVPSACPYPDPTGADFETVRICMPRSRLFRLLWEQLRLPSVLKKGSVDLLHAPAYLAPLLSKVPVVLTVYDLQALRFPELCLPLNRLNYRVMLSRSIRMARGIIAPSHSVAGDIAELFPEVRGRVRVIPLGVASAFKPLEPNACSGVLAKFGIDKPYIMFAGNMIPNKNLISLVRAFSVMKRNHGLPHRLVLVGRKAHQYRKIRDSIRMEGLTDEVIFTDYVSLHELVCLYNAADLFAFPSLYEGFGLPPLEAMACGTPVVCSDAGGLAETVGTAASFVDPADVAGIASTVAGLIKDSGLREALIKRGFEQSKSFTWEKARQQTETFYEEVLSCP